MVARLSTFAADARSTVLTGLSLLTSSAITATDTILVALGKLQAQITALAAAGVSSFNTRTGAVTLASADLTTPLTTPPPLGATTPNTGAFTTLSLTGRVTMTGNIVDWGVTGTGPPTFTTRSAGAKLVLYDPPLSGTQADYALGIDVSTLWLGVPSATQQFQWYAGTTLVATLTGTGGLTLVGPLAASVINSTPIGTTTPAAGFFTNISNATDIGRNLAHNGLFRVQQRGAGPWTAAGAFTADRWQLGLSGDANSVTVSALTDTARTAIGDEAAAFTLANVFTGAATATNYSQMLHRIEDVRRLAGRTVTVSFWAACATGTLNLGVRLSQVFGTGGSPSTVVNINGTAVAVTTTWTRFSVTFTLAALTGKTLGTNNDHYTQLGLGYSSGTTNATLLGVGVQSGTVNLWGVQVEFGALATPLEKPDIRLDLANCQRFYQIGEVFSTAYTTTGSGINVAAFPPVTLRASPSLVITTNSCTNINATPTLNYAGVGIIYGNGVCTATGPFTMALVYTASADL